MRFLCLVQLLNFTLEIYVPVMITAILKLNIIHIHISNFKKLSMNNIHYNKITELISSKILIILICTISAIGESSIIQH
jgi:hypothetical protein